MIHQIFQRLNEWQGRQRTKEHFRHAVKTGIAGVASLAVAELVRLPEGYWAVISAVIVMQSNIGAAVRAGLSRLAGTAIGAVTGAVFMTFWGVNLLSFGVATTLTVLACAFLGLLDSYRLASATVAIVMLFKSPLMSWVVALHRFMEVSLGVVVALVVTSFIWPSRAGKKLHHGIADMLLLLSSLYEVVVRGNGVDAGSGVVQLRAKVAARFRSNQDLFKQTMYEPPLGPEQKELLALLMEHVHRILHAVDALEPAARKSSSQTLHDKFEPELKVLVERIGKAMKRLAEEVSAWKFSLPEGELSEAISDLEAKTSVIRQARLTVAHDLDEIMHFYSFFHALRNLAQEVDMAREACGQWMANE